MLCGIIRRILLPTLCGAVFAFEVAMPCYSPLHAWRSKHVNPSTGRRGIVFSRLLGFADQPIDLPCGQCIGCRLERSRQWAMRCMHEASLYSDNCFITLTYDDAHLPVGNSLVLRHFQLFMKSLRKCFSDISIRFFHCGEYGSINFRPHYHACLFNFDFPDKVLHSVSNGNRLYVSEILSNLWSRGFCLIGSVSFESAAYVARYIVDKVTGDRAAFHYEYVDSDGVICSRTPEYVTMSRRPGIGRGWYERYKREVFPSDQVIVRGKAMPPPRFYSSIYEVEDPSGYAAVKARRRVVDPFILADNDSFRLPVKEQVKLAQISSLMRSFDD